MKTHLLILFLLHTHLAFCSGSSPDLLKNAKIESMQSSSTSCGGGVGKCAAAPAEVGAGEEEFGMDSEVSRRILAMQKRYISYDTLRRDAVPCSTPGASYYNCGSAHVNRYHRGCEIITRCARAQ